jgi:hypothetical protein
MYITRKMWPLESIPGIRGGEIKDNDGRANSSMMYLI